MTNECVKQQLTDIHCNNTADVASHSNSLQFRTSHPVICRNKHIHIIVNPHMAVMHFVTLLICDLALILRANNCYHITMENTIDVLVTCIYPL